MELTAEQIEERNKLIQEGYDEQPPEMPEVKDEPEEQEDPVVEQEEEQGEVVEQEEETEEPDRIELLVKELDGLKGRLSDYDQLKYRLKQAESRVGSLTNELHNAKKAAKEVKEAPSKQEIEAAAKDDEAWESLKEEWPEWAAAMDSFDRRVSRKLDGIPDVSAIREELQTDFDQKLTTVQQQFEERLVEVRHKGWKQTVASEDFAKWIVGQDDSVKQLASSSRAEDAIDLIDRFKEASKPQGKTAAEINKEREARLKKSTETKRSGKTTKTITEDDMTPEQLRAHILKKAYEED